MSFGLRGSCPSKRSPRGPRSRPGTRPRSLPGCLWRRVCGSCSWSVGGESKLRAQPSHLPLRGKGTCVPCRRGRTLPRSSRAWASRACTASGRPRPQRDWRDSLLGAGPLFRHACSPGRACSGLACSASVCSRGVLQSDTHTVTGSRVMCGQAARNEACARDASRTWRPPSQAALCSKVGSSPDLGPAAGAAGGAAHGGARGLGVSRRGLGGVCREPAACSAGPPREPRRGRGERSGGLPELLPVDGLDGRGRGGVPNPLQP